MSEDYIDFPVSADWIDFYHERGLTPRSSGRLSRTESMLLERIKALEEQIARQQDILFRLVRALASSRVDALTRSSSDPVLNLPILREEK